MVSFKKDKPKKPKKPVRIIFYLGVDGKQYSIRTDDNKYSYVYCGIDRGYTGTLQFRRKESNMLQTIPEHRVLGMTTLTDRDYYVNEHIESSEESDYE